MKTPTLLDQIQIATPCPASWDKMIGDERVRFCELCKLNVYNFAELRPSEIENLLRQEDRVCGRLYRRTDGTLITKDCPVGLKALRKRVARRAGAVLTAILSLAGIALPKSNPIENSSSEVQIEQGSARYTSSVIEGEVTDPLEAVVVGADLQLKDTSTGEVLETKTNDVGKYRFDVKRLGTYVLRVSSPGFKTAFITEVQVRANQQTRITIMLDVGEVMGNITVERPSIIDDMTDRPSLGPEHLIIRAPRKP